jgi:pyridoxamine 5'-phosphate oxidase
MVVPPVPWRASFEEALTKDRPNPRVQVATVSLDGVPAVRTVILRGLLGDGTPWFFTDGRSRKVDHLGAEPHHLALNVWFEATRQQFRLSGAGAVHGATASAPWDAIRRAQWARLPEVERAPFSGPVPGCLFIDGSEQLPAASEVPPSFVLVSLAVSDVDRLTLGPPHHRESHRLVGATWLSQRLNP